MPRQTNLTSPLRISRDPGTPVRVAISFPLFPAALHHRALTHYHHLHMQAITSTFETIAGRSAMIGFAAAAAAEILLPHQAGGLFGAWEQAQVFGILVLCLCSASAALALKSPMKIGRSRLLEPVLASLTSESRSAGAITRANVDRALDSTLDSVFNPVFVRTVFPIEIEFQLNTMDGLESDMDAEDIPLF